MITKIIKIIQNPKKIVIWISFVTNRMLVRKKYQNSQMFYKYKNELYPGYLNQGNAMSFIVEKAKAYCKGKGIDVGADKWPFPGAIAIQNQTDKNAYKLDHFNNSSLDYVFSSHCLEHLEDWQTALKLWIKKLKQNGVLFLYLPHKSMKLWNPGGPWVGLGHRWTPTCDILVDFLASEGMEIIEHDPGKDEYWSFHVVSKKII